jgi:hypothetical protein
VRTATYWGDHGDEVLANDLTSYAALARGSNKDVPDDAYGKGWSGGYAQTVLKDARLTDRLWVQIATYGPPQPWTDSFSVKRLTVC